MTALVKQTKADVVATNCGQVAYILSHKTRDDREQLAIQQLHEAGSLIKDLAGRLALADAAFMAKLGCFPLDRTNDTQRLVNDACRAIREVTGDDHGLREEAAAFYRAKWLAEQRGEAI